MDNDSPAADTSKRTWKPTRKQLLDGWIGHVSTPDCLQDFLNQKGKFLKSKNVTLQPFPLVVGLSLYDATDFYVVLAPDHFFKVDTFDKAIEYTYKALWALNAAYPYDCTQLWYCIQELLFKMDFNKRAYNIGTLGLIHRLSHTQLALS